MDTSKYIKSPLTTEDIDRIESSYLSPIIKHRIRLFAHCLACFKEITKNSSQGALPSKEIILNWLLEQPSLADDPDFVYILLEQFLGVEKYLEKLALERKISPLELTLDDLLNEALKDR